MSHGFLKLTLALAIFSLVTGFVLGLVGLVFGNPIGVDPLTLVGMGLVVWTLWPEYKRGEEELKRV